MHWIEKYEFNGKSNDRRSSNSKNDDSKGNGRKGNLMDWLQNSNLQKLMKVLDPCMAVGGCVRNSMIGKGLNDEVDLATPLLPEEVMRLAKKAGFKVIPTGLQHGTVTCVMDGDVFEVTTLRVDIDTDGRHAQVEFSKSWEEDAKRRDLTINALYADINGKIYDFVGGLDDIKKGMIRFIGDPDLRIQEDYLRILRFFRFLAHYGKNYDFESLHACKKYVQNLQKIARERCINEMMKLLDACNFISTLRLMDDINIWEHCDFPKPNFDVLENIIVKEKAMNLKSSALAKFASFDGSIENVKLSNLQKKNIKLLRNVNVMKEKSDYIKWINEVPSDLWNDGFILKGALDDLQFLEPWKKNLFHFSGNDVMNIMHLPSGPGVKKYLDKLKEWFVEQDAPAPYSDLIKQLEIFRKSQ
ncbi:CCA tRNA nucleotidyltransferase [Candidatus Cytomitobacter primus]|nr:CCA tRNA nucleotidyltransferase [Candidatus Cytomitobacter primus]